MRVIPVIGILFLSLSLSLLYLDVDVPVIGAKKPFNAAPLAMLDARLRAVLRDDDFLSLLLETPKTQEAMTKAAGYRTAWYIGGTRNGTPMIAGKGSRNHSLII